MADLIDSYLSQLRSEGRAVTTITTYADILHRLDRELPAGLACAHADELRDWIYTDQRRPATRALYRAACVGFFAWATEPSDPRLDFDPTRWLPRVRLPRRSSRTLPDDQLGDILARANGPFRRWCLLAAGAGLRCCEIALLDREHVSSESIWVQGKGGKERVVPTHPSVWAAVRDQPPGPLARTPDGTARASRRQVICRANFHLQRTLGQSGVTMHRLRHWYGTNVHEAAGGDIRVSQELLGHASPATTQVYVDTTRNKKAAAVAALVLP